MVTRILTFLLLPFGAFAQVGIGTATPATSARLEVSSTNKGFLPPRVSLQGTDDATKTTPTIASPATGLMVYNTATAGSGATAITPGIYYYDGSRWQRVINQQPDVTVEFNTTNPNTGSPVFTPNTPQSSNVVYISSSNYSQWTWNGSSYVTYTPTPNTAWMISGGTNDAGSNKTSDIYRNGNVGIGAGTFSPTAKLDIRANSVGTGFRLVDGSQGVNKVLQSDVNGNASWATNVAVTPAVTGIMSSTANNIGQNTYTGARITLPPGKWSVQVTMLGNYSGSGSIWVRTGLSTSTSSLVNTDAIGSSLVSGWIQGNKYGMILGTLIINNTSGANKTYYYWTGSYDAYDGAVNWNSYLTGFASNGNSENSIIAYPMN